MINLYISILYMNCFNNNAPKISASEHLRNKEAKTLYKNKVLEYKKGLYKRQQGNILFNRNGTIKKTSNYQAKHDIAKGYYLANCNEDCNTYLQTTKINTGANSIYNKFDGSGCSTDCSGGFPVLYSRIISPDPLLSKSKLVPSQPLINGYLAPIMEMNHIIIDPSNNLFGTNDCKKKYLQHTSYDEEESDKCNKNTQQNYMQHLYRNNIGNLKLYN